MGKEITQKEVVTVTALSLLAGGCGGFYLGYRTFASKERKKTVRTAMKLTLASKASSPDPCARCRTLHP